MDLDIFTLLDPLEPLAMAEHGGVSSIDKEAEKEKKRGPIAPWVDRATANGNEPEEYPTGEPEKIKEFKV